MTSVPSLLTQPFSVVDVETTGASAIYDRVIEVAAVRLEGGRIVDRWESLVDPGIPVPPFITRLTGIDDRTVRGRPTFGRLVPRLQEALGDGPFVAHNVSFDYAFLRHGLTRAGASLDLPRLCTLRLARRLVPRLRSHRLSTLLAHFGIETGRRHRALADAEGAALLLLRLIEVAADRGIATLDELLLLQGRAVTRHPRGVDESVLEALPAGHGVYLLKDAEGHVVYVGKSVHVRQRVREHLRGGSPDQPRLRRRLHAIVDVEAIETGSELEALFLESRLIKRYLPDANLLQRNDRDYPFIRIDVADPFPRLEATREPPIDGALHFGPFRRRATAAGAVDFLQDQLRLRRCTDPIRPGQSACALLDLGKCLGPCIGAVDGAEYRAAVRRAADLLRGRDGSLLDELTRRRDELAEELRFEEAARLRDRIRELEHVVGVQRRLDAVAERNLAIVAPSPRPKHRELFLIRNGQLVHQLSAPTGLRRTTVAKLLGEIFAARPARAVTREAVDEMHLLDGWLRRHGERLTTIPVDAAGPLGAVDAIIAALRATRPESRKARPSGASARRGRVARAS
jgi:DNA polymerase III subunit epsilon